MAARDYILGLRLDTPKNAPSIQIKLSKPEMDAVMAKASGTPPGTFLRWIVQAAVGSDESVLDLAKGRAESANLGWSAWVRLVVLEAVGHTSLKQDFERACQVAKG